VLNKQRMQEIEEERLTATINVELGLLVTQGLLEMGITEEGDAVFWPTPKGEQVLGMGDEQPDRLLSA
jgi:hypothetical protein